MAASQKPEVFLTDAGRAQQKRRYWLMLLVTTLSCFGALFGVVGHVSLHQVWGLPLFFLALATGVCARQGQAGRRFGIEQQRGLDV